jgi:hypothetical protein
MTLAELQSGFRTWLTEASDDAGQQIAGRADAPGLSVYQNNYRGQLVAALQSTFPNVRAFMGEEAFLHAAIKHVEANPPHAWTLDAYADQFGETLRTEFPNNPDIHDLAWIEHSLGTAFVAGDAQPLNPADLAGIDWDNAKLKFSPSLMTAQGSTNASDIWWALQEGGVHPEGEMLAETNGLVVWRRGFVSCLNTLDAQEYEALQFAQSNGSFNGLCEFLIERLGEDEGVAKAGGLLADWIGSEILVGVEE